MKLDNSHLELPLQAAPSATVPVRAKRRTVSRSPLDATAALLIALLPGIAIVDAQAQELPVAVTAEPQFNPVDRDEAALGQLLFWDPLLSGNRNISCGTCHHPRFGTSDGLSLGMGEGGIGVGPKRHPDPDNLPEQRIPRNAPALFNLGAKEFRVLFHDGRIEADASRPSGIRTPLEDDMLRGFASVLSAQAMFPVLSQDEMAGHYSENDVSRAARQGRITGPGGAWDLIARRVAAVDAYRNAFERVYPQIAAGRAIGFTDISNAIAAFVAFEWRADDSPFDRYLRGQAALSTAADAGMQLFYGKAGCGSCHAGRFQTDHDFHAMGVPQIGPGKGERFETNARDLGRMRVTGRAQDAYAFRTPSLRNITATAPYGHDGAYATLPEFLTAHLDPTSALDHYGHDQAVLPEQPGANDWVIQDDAAERGAIRAAVSTVPVKLSAAEIAQLVAFLEALTDETAINGRLGVPQQLPSGLPVDR